MRKETQVNTRSKYEVVVREQLKDVRRGLLFTR